MWWFQEFENMFCMRWCKQMSGSFKVRNWQFGRTQMRVLVNLQYGHSQESAHDLRHKQALAWIFGNQCSLTIKIAQKWAFDAKNSSSSCVFSVQMRLMYLPKHPSHEPRKSMLSESITLGVVCCPGNCCPSESCSRAFFQLVLCHVSG